MGNRVQETDADGNTRTTTWLEHRALPAAIIEADGSATRFWYDEHHGLKRVVDPMGQTTQLRRDAFGQVVEEVDAAGNSRYQEYNEAGRGSAFDGLFRAYYPLSLSSAGLAGG